MAFDLGGKNALVTGASRGIGRAIAQGLASAGAQVVVNYNRNRGAADETVSAIQQAGGKAWAVQADVSLKSDVERLFSEARGHFDDRLDILVNNAGGPLDSHALDVMPEEAWDQCIAVNLKSVFLCSRRAIPFMLRGGGGSIVNTASCLAFGSVGRISPYAASKAGIIGMMRDMAHEFGKDGIRINTICPGVVNTPMLNRSFGTEEERAAAFARIEEALPLRRIGEPIDYANLAMFLASPMSSYITGQWIAVDGGMMCRLPLT